MTPSIDSKRLELIVMTPPFLRASMDGDLREAERQLQISLPADWPGDAVDAVSLRIQQLEVEPALQPWLLRAMVLRGTRIMIGHIGCHTAPNAEYLRAMAPGAVEFGFTVFPDFRRQGYAREASLALMTWAHQTHGVSRFVLSIRPDNVPSQALAAQLGFHRIGSHIDEVDGLEDILEFQMPDPAALEPKV
jgi:RimJ/RimL family protein N-acetyltransferase